MEYLNKTTEIKNILEDLTLYKRSSFKLFQTQSPIITLTEKLKVFMRDYYNTVRSSLSTTKDIIKEVKHLCNLISDLKFTVKDLENPPLQICLSILIGSTFTKQIFKPGDLMKDGNLDYTNTEILNRFKSPNIEKIN